jgi:hypothetical protein
MNHSLQTLNERLEFDPATARLVSLRSLNAPDQEFIHSSEDHPTFVIGFFDEKRNYHQVGSLQARNVNVTVSRQDDHSVISASYHQVDGLELDIHFSISASPAEPFCRWKLSVDNFSGLELINVQFPFVVCAYDLAGKQDSESVVLPHGYSSGQLIQNFKGEEWQVSPYGVFWRRKLKPDTWTAWVWNEGNIDHYPGWQFAQFMAYYNDRAGLYLACEDHQGYLKSFKILDRNPGFRLAVAHLGDWPQEGSRQLEYDIVLGSFQGDWYTAADIYREWSLKQPWFIPLHRRKDVPEWLLDSPVYITIRPQGILDEGPVFPVQEFLPYEKCIPLLERISDQVKAPVTAVLMGWEHAGSWIYPDCFPPIGGDESLANFTRLARQRGWHVGSFGNGTQWLIGDGWNNYDGQNFFREMQGETAICRRPDGSGWLVMNYWRPGYPCCLGTPLTRKIANEYFSRLVGWGFESIQFFDQNCFAITFACFAKDHEHPPLPGRWMNQVMAKKIAEFREIASQAGEAGLIHSAEAGVNEYCLQLFQEADVRVFPPGWENNVIPLYQYLFHECLVLNGMMSAGQEPYHIEISAAINGVLGGIPGGVLKGNGALMDKDTINWAPWEPSVGDEQSGFAVLRTVTALRRGPGKEFLVFGRMLRPANVIGIYMMRWEWGGRKNHVPSVFHSAWQAPDGRVGIVLINWTGNTRRVIISDARACLHSNEKLKITTVFPDRVPAVRFKNSPQDDLRIFVPARASILIESPGS